MPTFARTAKGAEPEVRSLEEEGPYFLEIRFADVPPLSRIMSQARAQGCRTVVIENLPETDDIREENEDIRKRFPNATCKGVYRLSFFSSEFSAIADVRSGAKGAFVGYAVVKTDMINNNRTSRVFESVISPALRTGGFARGLPEWECVAGAESLRVEGCLYAQHNGITNVCAHVALRAAVGRFLPERDMTYRRMNDILGVNHVDRKFDRRNGLKGLTARWMGKVLDAVDANYFVEDYRHPKPGDTKPPFYRNVYGSVESGYPAIIFFAAKASGLYHAIPVFGHTFTQDTWVPDADREYFARQEDYVSSQSWLGDFIGHDGNFGSNYTIPARYLYAKRLCYAWPKTCRNTNRRCISYPDRPRACRNNNRKPCGQWPMSPLPCQMDAWYVAYVISTVPKDVRMKPHQAEVKAWQFMLGLNLVSLPREIITPWYTMLLQNLGNRSLVLRPILVDAQQYLDHLRKMRGFDDRPLQDELIAAAAKAVEGRLWMIEASTPELFPGDRRKLGEVLVSARSSVADDTDSTDIQLVRMPGFFARHSVDDLRSREHDFYPSNIESPVQLYGCEGPVPS